MPSGVVPAVDARASLGVAALGVAVALASLAVREVPEAGLALAASSAVCVRSALASASFNVAEIIQRPYAVAVARDAALRAKTVRSRRATIATSADDVLLARASAAVIFAEQTVRASRVTLASVRPVVNVVADAVLILLANVRYIVRYGVEVVVVVTAAIPFVLLAAKFTDHGHLEKRNRVDPRPEDDRVDQNGRGRCVSVIVEFTELQQNVVSFACLQADGRLYNHASRS